MGSQISLAFHKYSITSTTTTSTITTSIATLLNVLLQQVFYSPIKFVTADYLYIRNQIIPILTSTPNEFVTHRYLKQKHQSHLFCYNRIVRVFDLILLPFLVRVGT